VCTHARGGSSFFIAPSFIGGPDARGGKTAYFEHVSVVLNTTHDGLGGSHPADSVSFCSQGAVAFVDITADASRERPLTRLGPVDRACIGRSVAVSVLLAAG
jgi:hypothetical protein